MIPKKIHYIWLSGDEKPEMIRKCLRSWERMAPDFEVREWSSRDFSFDTMPDFVREAYTEKKWAFVSDYLRLYLLFNHGGIYLDSDVYLKKPLDILLMSEQTTAVTVLTPTRSRPCSSRVSL